MTKNFLAIISVPSQLPLSVALFAESSDSKLDIFQRLSQDAIAPAAGAPKASMVLAMAPSFHYASYNAVVSTLEGTKLKSCGGHSYSAAINLSLIKPLNEYLNLSLSYIARLGYSYRSSQNDDRNFSTRAIALGVIMVYYTGFDRSVPPGA
ncbi:MAG: hypothetical protein LBE38_05220 [Deltaproteobacteria bacterium]|jgi:hypothetical protein|nr:hypothetical protein [Deltaproteobacteria bacterium]